MEIMIRSVLSLHTSPSFAFSFRSKQIGPYFCIGRDCFRQENSLNKACRGNIKIIRKGKEFEIEVVMPRNWRVIRHRMFGYLNFFVRRDFSTNMFIGPSSWGPCKLWHYLALSTLNIYSKKLWWSGKRINQLQYVAAFRIPIVYGVK